MRVFPRSRTNLFKCHVKFIYSEKAIKFCEIFTLLLSYVVPVKSKVKISQKFVAFLENMNFKYKKMCNKFRTFAHVRVLFYVCDVGTDFGLPFMGPLKEVASFIRSIEPRFGRSQNLKLVI